MQRPPRAADGPHDSHGGRAEDHWDHGAGLGDRGDVAGVAGTVMALRAKRCHGRCPGCRRRRPAPVGLRDPSGPPPVLRANQCGAATPRGRWPAAPPAPRRDRTPCTCCRDGNGAWGWQDPMHLLAVQRHADRARTQHPCSSVFIRGSIFLGTAHGMGGRPRVPVRDARGADRHAASVFIRVHPWFPFSWLMRARKREEPMYLSALGGEGSCDAGVAATAEWRVTLRYPALRSRGSAAEPHAPVGMGGLARGAGKTPCTYQPGLASRIDGVCHEPG